MRTFIFLLLVFANLSFIHAQEKKNNRYQFAHTYFGLESEFLPQNNNFTILNNDGTHNSQELPSILSKRFVIGGTHFWGHADFYISIPLFGLKLKGSEQANISNGVLTGFKYFPLKIKPNSIRPYLGVGFGGAPYRQEGSNGKGATQNNRQWYYESGISYRYKGSKLFEFGTRYFTDKEFNYYFSREEQGSVSLNQFSFLFSYKKLFDFTQAYAKPEMKQYVKRAYDALEKEKALSTFSIGFGYSATIPLETTEFSGRIPFLNQETTRNGNIDLGLAYYFHKVDAAARLSYRPLKQKEEAYGYSTSTRVNAFALEAFKFVGDYHGFVPFVGPYLGFNNYRIKETDFNETVVDFKDNKLAYGLVFGWDIRISDIDYIILRTNLRYTPNLGYQKDDLDYTNRQLEFNFIQLVYYPERHKVSKTL